MAYHSTEPFRTFQNLSEPFRMLCQRSVSALSAICQRSVSDLSALCQRSVSAQSALSQRLVMITNHLYTRYGSPELYF